MLIYNVINDPSSIVKEKAPHHRRSAYWHFLFSILLTLFLAACNNDESNVIAPPLTIDFNTEDSTPALKAGDITYAVDRFTQGTVGSITPTSSTWTNFSGLTFSIASISRYIGPGTQEQPTIAEDGTISNSTTTTAGSYRVTITPDGSTISGDPITVDFYVTVKAANIADLDAKLQQGVTSYGLNGDLNYLDTSAVTNMSYLFRSGYTPGTGVKSTRTYIKNFNGDIGKWDVSAVENFSIMFYEAEAFNGDISKWDVSSGTDFTGMFFRAKAFNSDISKWVVSSGKNFTAMFYEAEAFNQDIGDWVVSAGENFSSMFSKTIAFNQDIGRWNVAAGKQFHQMFYNAKAFNQDIGDWVVSAGENFSSMFYEAIAFNQDIGRWNVATGKQFHQMFYNAKAFNQDIGDWVVSAGKSFHYMFSGATSFNQDISEWDVGAGTDFHNMFHGATVFDQDLSDWSVDPTDQMLDIFTGSGVTNLPAWCIPTLHVGDVTYDVDGLAQGTAGTATPSSPKIHDLSGLKFSIASISTPIGTHTPPTITEDGTITTTPTTSAGSYRVTITPDGRKTLGNPITVDFYVTVKAADIADLDAQLKQGIAAYRVNGDFNYLDTSAVTDMSYLFSHENIPGSGVPSAFQRNYIMNFNGDISKWDVSAVEDFNSMFKNATTFNRDISKWDVSSGEVFTGMFYNATAFNQNIGGWDVAAGTTFNLMFYGAKAFNRDLSDWSIDSNDDTNNMFTGSRVTDLPSWYKP